MENHEEETWQDILNSAIFGMLTTIRHKDGLPSTNPVSFVWDGDNVKISSLKSRVKYRNIENNPAVAFCAMSQRDVTRYVELRGHATVEDDHDLSLFKEQFRRGAGMDPPEDLDPPGAERIVITIHAEQVSSPTLYGGRLATEPK